MSHTANQSSLIEFLRTYIEKSSTNYLSDLSHIPKEQLAEIPTEPKKPAMDYIAECTEENLEIAHLLRGEQFSVPCYEGMTHEHHSIEELNKLTEDLEKSASDLLHAVEELGDKGLTNEVVTPDGEKIPAYRLATRAANHMKYHDLFTGVDRPH